MRPALMRRSRQTAVVREKTLAPLLYVMINAAMSDTRLSRLIWIGVLVGEQCPFHVKAVTVSTDAARCDHAMAGDEECDKVR